MADVPSVKTTLSLTLRGMRLIARQIPRLFPLITAHAAVTALTPYITLWLFAQVFDRVLDGADASAVWIWTAVAVTAEMVFVLLGGILKRRKEMRWEWVYRRTDRLLMDALLALDPAAAADPETAQLLLKAKENMQALGAGLVRIPALYQSFVGGVFGLLGAAVCAWSLVAACAFSPLWVLLAAVLWCAMIGGAFGATVAAQRKRAAVTADVVANDRAYEALLAAATSSQSTTKRASLVGQMYAAEQPYFSKNGIKRRLAYGSVGVCEALAASLTALWWGVATAFAVLKAVGGAFGFGAAVWYIGAAVRATDDAVALLQSVQQARANVPCLETVFQFLDIPCTMYVGSLTTEKRGDSDYEITFDRVSFRYPGQTAWALYDVSFTLRGGQTLAVIGEEGSGKTTLAMLLCRLYDPTEGVIYLNGIDIRKYRPEDYRALVAAAFCDSPLFAEPLGAVVACAKDFDAARVSVCLAQRGFCESVSLYEPLTPTVSQRHAILAARALYKDCPFLVLDETPIRVNAPHRAVVYTARTPRDCPACDSVLVLSDGAVAAYGSYASIIADRVGEHDASR